MFYILLWVYLLYDDKYNNFFWWFFFKLQDDDFDWTKTWSHFFLNIILFRGFLSLFEAAIISQKVSY